MHYFYGVLAACVCTALAFAIFQDKYYQKMKLLHAASAEEQVMKTYEGRKLILLLGVVFVISFFAAMRIFQRVGEPINLLKMLVALVSLTGCACVDFREKRIPNFFPAIMALSAVILLAIGYCTHQNGAKSYIVSGLISAAGSAVMLSVAALLTKGGIGAGDIKTLSALGLLCGVYTLCETVFVGMALCAVVGIAALATKKKKLQESLPFGPFILVGFAVSVIFFSI